MNKGVDKATAVCMFKRLKKSSPPVAHLVYFNVGRANATLNRLRGRIEALETEIEQFKTQAVRCCE